MIASSSSLRADSAPFVPGALARPQTRSPLAAGVSEESGAYHRFVERFPKLSDLDVELRHLLGEELEALSMAQLEEMSEVTRSLVGRLEEARLTLVRRQEREVVEERMIQTFERIHEMQQRAPPPPTTTAQPPSPMQQVSSSAC